jgi:uncharacterized membrane protein YfcA
VSYAAAALLGAFAGVLAGMFGVGGGILFVPVLVGLGLGQHDATGTSLLAILPTVVVGTWRQTRYGNVRWEPALIVGVASVGAAQGGAFLAEALPAHVLRKLFAVLLVFVAGQIAWRAYRAGRERVEAEPEL